MNANKVLGPLAMLAAAASLSACYIVPIDYYPPVAPVAPMAAPAVRPMVYTGRLYPVNETAGKMGGLTATVTDDANGHATFSLPYAGEVLQGEASRVDGKRGVATATGPSGTYVRCQYALATHNRGTGECQFSNGARYQLHFGG